MNRKKPTISDPDDAVKQYFAEKIADVEVPPVPSPDLQSGILRTTIPKVAAAVLLITCGAFFFIRPVKPNPLEETFAYLVEERQLEEKIVSGLQRAGHFISDTLVNKEYGGK